ncbi:MAG: hypothetical protein Ct9H90mP18_06250 [Gammaproteobacteria bacterium]|nr:MAG: hypothetical protein Ct9H90mP18_06250 [Gammaproteobacteria bacterium]
MRRRLAYSRIQDKKAVKKLFEVLGLDLRIAGWLYENS